MEIGVYKCQIVGLFKFTSRTAVAGDNSFKPLRTIRFAGVGMLPPMSCLASIISRFALTPATIVLSFKVSYESGGYKAFSPHADGLKNHLKSTLKDLDAD